MPILPNLKSVRLALPILTWQGFFMEPHDSFDTHEAQPLGYIFARDLDIREGRLRKPSFVLQNLGIITMRFGKTLQDSVYEPWKVHYIDYSKLKKLLREEEVANGRFSSTTVKQPWTDEDEGKFVEELINVQLERVNAFQAETHRQLRDRTAKCEAELEKIASQEKGQPNQKDSQNTPKIEEDDFRKEKLKELDDITNEISELEKYSRINYTGFLKAAKKHDRRRGSSYRVRPLLQVRLATMPFNSEDYSPLLYR